MEYMGKKLKVNTNNSKYNVNAYLGMLKYMRPDGSVTQQIFCDKYLLPVFGKPDIWGNYSLVVGEGSDIIFTAHHDTVHRKEGLQEPVLYWENDKMYVKLSQHEIRKGNATCLGADCTTGIFIILSMIEAKIPGLYVIHSAEEIGGVGSRGFVEDNADLLKNYNFVISFDRYGQSEIITHQSYTQTASVDFAQSLSGILGNNLIPSPDGLFTDSANYIDHVKECTNIAVGYTGHHTKTEKQDVTYMFNLINKLIKADWSKLVIGEFDPIPVSGRNYWQKYSWTDDGYMGTSSNTVIDQDDYMCDDTKPYGTGKVTKQNSEIVELYDILDFVDNNSFFIAELIREQGFSYDYLMELKKKRHSNVPKAIQF